MMVYVKNRIAQDLLILEGIEDISNMSIRANSNLIKKYSGLDISVIKKRLDYLEDGGFIKGNPIRLKRTNRIVTYTLTRRGQVLIYYLLTYNKK